MKMKMKFDTDLSLPLILSLPEDRELKKVNGLLDWKLIKKILSYSGKRIFSLDGSMEFWVISYLIGQFKDDQGDSTDYQAAANLISTTTNFKICFILFPLMSLFTLGGPLLGKMKINIDTIEEAKAKYNRLPRNTLLVGAPFTIVATSTLFFSDQLWKMLGRSDSVISLIQEFLMPLSLLTPVIVVRFLTEGILFMGEKSSTVVSTALSSWLVFGVFTSYVLGMGGIGNLTFPALKIPGVFLGFTAQILISTLILMGVVKKSTQFKDFHFLNDFLKWTPIDAQQVREIIPISLANWFAIIAELTAQLTTNIIAANLGVTQLAMMDFVAQVNFLSLLWTYALGQVTQQLVGMELGAENKIEASRVAKYALGMSLFPAPLYLLLAFKPQFLTDLTSKVDTDVLQYIDIIPYACLTSLLYTFQYVMLEALRPTQKFYRSLSLAIMGLWTGVIAGYCFSKDQDIFGIARGSLLGGGFAVLGVAYDFSKNFLMSSQAQERPLPESKYNSGNEIEYEQVSTNRYGCFSSFRRLYKRLFQTQETTDLTGSRFVLQ